MKAVVLERAHELSLRDIDLPLKLGPRDVKIAVDTVGICGSDVHYYTHGRIGSFIVKSPMVLGHEAAGVVVEVGSEVKSLKPGDRVCMEPGVPDMSSRSSRLGQYNVDPSVTLLGDAAGPRLPHGPCHPSGGLHLQAARQRQLRRGRAGRAVRDRNAGGRPRPGSRRATSRS